MIGETFIVLFRGVGGATQLPTKPLREALTEAGFRSVATYIASGNVVLASGLSADEVKARVAAIVGKKLGFSKSIFVVTRQEWGDFIAQNPFPEAVDRPTTLHAFALEAEPSREAVQALAARAAASERVVVKGKVLYFHAPEGFGTSKLPPIIDRTLEVATTARNWNTVLKLGELARTAASR
ncbi:MAG: DUF1697 domain-containing protein [Rhizobiales bacterium]|nr:DUF1697 domain-containing protein [Hyphomicrobiales bacterium]MDQ3559678.1 DUF1697 domain-containing protein [Pseudomonadota bacterium]